MLNQVWDYVTGNRIETLAFVISIIGIWLTAKERILNWPVNIIASALSIYVFYIDALYGDAALNGFFVVMCFYGWYEWLYGGKDKHQLQITGTTAKTAIILIAITAPASFALGILLSHTASTVPYFDGITTALSLAATWMAARKLIENWLVWIFTDLIYVAMYNIKHLYLYSVLYFIFTLLAVYGYIEWRKQLTTKSAE